MWINEMQEFDRNIERFDFLTCQLYRLILITYLDFFSWSIWGEINLWFILGL